jgi:NTP pyrophosphatase (non-canonical NTP hydrolase)
MEVKELQHQINAWASEVFPDRTTASAMLKLYEELGELLRSPSDPEEHADIFIILMDLSTMHGVDIESAVMQKLAKNRTRIWEKTQIGTMQHKSERHD